MNQVNFTPAKRALLNKWLQGQGLNDSMRIPPHPENEPVLLSYPQQRQLFLELLEPGTAVNNLSVFLKIGGKLDVIALEKSANQIIARHDALRTFFSYDRGLLVPVVIEDLHINISVIKLPENDIPDQLAEARHLAEQDVLYTFNLTMAPLIRVILYSINNEKHCLLVVVHHTIADGWSLGIFLEELMLLYQHNTTGRPISLPELPIQYADYAYWQNREMRNDKLQSSLQHWKSQLAGELPVLELPTDYPRGSKQNFSGGTCRFTLPAALTTAVEKISRDEDVTPFMTLLAAYFVLLHRYSGQDDILVGTPTANRTRPELEQLIGVFINTLVLRIKLDDNPDFRTLLKRVREVTLQAFAHQNLPFEKLVEELKPKRDLSRNALFQVMFNMQNSPMPELKIPGLEISFLEVDRGVTQFDLTLILSKSAGQYEATVEYNDGLFTSATIARMCQSYQLLLEDAIAYPNTPISGLQITSVQELYPFVYGLNQTRFDFPREKCMHQLFELQVEKTPDAVAVIYENTSITYADLNRRANLLAKHLQSLGVGPEVRVGIFMEKTLEIVEALLGVFKAGGAYVPVHTSFPTERVQFILNDADVKVLLTNIQADSMETAGIQIVNLPDDTLSTRYDTGNPQSSVKPGNLAYIMYTSGSTGFPKGVMVPHSALVNFLCSMLGKPGMNKDDVLLSVTPISFDIAALELFLPLIAGATVMIADKTMADNPVLTCNAIRRHHITVMQATPATWQLLLDTGWEGEPGLKALCGGEAFTRKLADQLLDCVGSLWNMYGPTETTIWSATGQVEKDNSPIAIGNPIANTQLYVLDRYLQPVPIGVVGELHIGGEGLARGYLNQPQLTSQKFIQDRLSAMPGARLYKTGDQARYLPDRSIQVLGRIDDQVKLNGYRIELDEIATVMRQCPAVQEAIVVVRKERTNEPRLVAYFTSGDAQSPGTGDLQVFMRKKLPGYMIPSAFVRLDKIPLTPNGKTDRNALPLPGEFQLLTGYVAPRNEVEEILVHIWQYVLALEQVSIHDNFFDLGGASIQSLQVVAKATLAGLRFSPEAIFEYQTIAELAAYLESQNHDSQKEKHGHNDNEYYSSDFALD